MKIGFIGGGMMAQIGHLPFYMDDPRCEVVAVCESRPSLIVAIRELYKGVAIVENHEDILADTSIEAVVISVPRPATGPLVLSAIEAGKHVVSEKPMAHTLDQGRQLVAAAQNHGRQYHVGFMKRYDTGVQAAKTIFDLLRNGNRLGQLLTARFYNSSAEYAMSPPKHTRPRESRPVRFPVWPTAPEWLAEPLRPAYAWYMNAISHDVNLIRFFLGNDLRMTSAIQHEGDAVIAMLTHRNVPITLEASRTAAGRWIEGAEFLFETGRLTVDIPSPMAVDETARISLQTREPLPEATLPKGDGSWCFERQARAFIVALVHNTPSHSTGIDCLGDLEVIEDIWRHIQN